MPLMRLTYSLMAPSELTLGVALMGKVEIWGPVKCLELIPIFLYLT